MSIGILTSGCQFQRAWVKLWFGVSMLSACINLLLYILTKLFIFIDKYFLSIYQIPDTVLDAGAGEPVFTRSHDLAIEDLLF